MRRPIAPAGTITMAEAAKRLGIARTRVYALVSMGQLTTVERDGQLWVPVAAVQRRLNEMRALESRCLSTLEVARRLQVSITTLMKWRDAGLLHTTKIHNRLCWDADEVASFRRPSTVITRRKGNHG